MLLHLFLLSESEKTRSAIKNNIYLGKFGSRPDPLITDIK